MGIIHEILSRVITLVERPTIVIGPTTANWNSGVATSGLAGADLFTYGVAGQWWRSNEAYFNLASFNAAATVTVRVYQVIYGVMQYAGGDDYVVALDDPNIYLLWWLEVDMYGPLRIELYSDQAADDGLAVPYEYRVKTW